MPNTSISPYLIIAFELILVAVSIRLLYIAVSRHRFLIRHSPTEFGPIHRNPFVVIHLTTLTSVHSKTSQGTAIKKLQDRLGNGVQVLTVDVAEQPEIAEHWGIQSIPATLLFNPTGELIHINHGVVRAETLLLQMYGIEVGGPTNRT